MNSKFKSLNFLLAFKKSSLPRKLLPNSHCTIYIYIYIYIYILFMRRKQKKLWTFWKFELIFQMGLFRFSNSIVFVVVFGLMNMFGSGFGARKLAALYEPPPVAIGYHNGTLLDGDVPVSILWYGKFTAAHKAVLVDFLLSLNSRSDTATSNAPPVSRWWSTVQVSNVKDI